MKENKDNNSSKENDIKEKNEEEVQTQTIDKEIDKTQNKQVSSKDKSDKITFSNLLKKGIINTLGTMFISVGILAILGLIFKYILGYYIIDPWGMLFIIFLIVSVFYPSINYVYKKKKKKD
ncbi:DNA-binding protein [Clostridium oceanicum]|uniref:Uncharacterized protein n=1 Tax=Clostridium oceanicum TaxID=1543 RepID=A0ABP3V4P1_9CLOT